jgi:Domain of unknown function (DUF4404)
MAAESLRELLAELRERLDTSGGALDAEARRLLATAMRDIERALKRPDQMAEQSAAAAAAHTPRLESLAVRFEAGHPAIAETVRELIDALVKAGI